MKVVILPTSYPNVYNENSSIFVQDQAKALCKNGVDVNVLGAIPISFKYIWEKKIFRFGNFKLQDNGISTHLYLFPSIPKLRKFNQFLRNRINKILLKEYLKHNEIDILHVHNATAGKAALWVKNNYNIPYCITEHSSSFARGNMPTKEMQSYQKIYEESSINIAVSRKFSKLLSNIYNLQFGFIPNVVDTDYFFKNKNKNKKRNSDKFIFINIANLNKNKNQIMLVNAFFKSFKNNKNIQLSILGAGSEYNTLQKEIDILNMNEQIKLFGFATREKVLKELKNSDAFVLSSNYETFGVVLIEAMSCGLPVISTRCGGPESIIIEKELGILVEKNNIDVLSNTMKMIYINKDKYSSDEIRKYVINNFSEKAISKKLSNIYQKVVDAN